MIRFDATKYRYPSERHVVYGKNGMVCSSQTLASQAGIRVLASGGNAVDAAVATAACLSVVEPTSNGLGSDLFALVWIEKDKKLYGLNSSGQSPKLLTADVVADGGQIPRRGWIPVMVPGAPAAWNLLTERFGSADLGTLMRPAIDHARNGYPVSPVVSQQWKAALNDIRENGDSELMKPWFQVFAHEGAAPEPGQIIHLSDQADTMEKIAQTGAATIYTGDIADKIDAYAKKTGGYLRKEDLKEFAPEWVEPISSDYHGYKVYEMPPNTHGLVVLMALNVFSGYSFEKKDSADCIHRQIESMKLAFAEGQQSISDPRYMNKSVQELLSEEYTERRRRLIGENARWPEADDPNGGGTVYFCTADKEGNMVSMIQSSYNDFGSGVVIPGTGIVLSDRGCNFSLDSENPNYMMPGKRSYHTIIPGFLFKGDQPMGPFGIMGGFMQPQAHLQVVSNMVDFGMNPQEALDAPRWQWIGDMKVEMEPGFRPELVEDLIRRGHEITITEDRINMGRGQIILRNEDGVYAGATEPRADGCVAAI